MSLRHRLAAIFSPTRRLLGADGSTALHQGGVLGGVEYVVPRAQCHYKRIDFSATPAKQRASASRLAAARLAPTPSARVHVAWQGAIAQVWICPDPPPEMSAADTPWIPETLLRPRPDHDGGRLLALVSGFEGQVWQGGQLTASRWWAAAPGDADWGRFLRAAGLAADAGGRPQGLEPEGFANEPWGDARTGIPGSPAALERVAWLATVGLLLLGFGWQLMGQASWRIASLRLQSNLEAVRAEATPLMEARERAETAAQSMAQWLQLQQSESDFALMAEVVRPLPNDVVLVGWQRDGERLQVGVTSTERDPRQYITAFESHPRLSDLNAVPADDGGMRLDFTLAVGQPEAAP